MSHYAHMVIHGMLHVQGLDHQNEEEANYMEAIESKIMQKLNFPSPYKEENCVE
jgi:probable rRNA maturation factor